MPRVGLATDSLSCRQFARTTPFGIAGASITAKQGRVYQVRFVNRSATRYFAQIHDRASAPVATNVPVYEASLPASGEVVIDFGLNGLAVSLGIGIAISTTSSVLTLPAADDAVAYGLHTVQT